MDNKKESKRKNKSKKSISSTSISKEKSISPTSISKEKSISADNIDISTTISKDDKSKSNPISSTLTNKVDISTTNPSATTNTKTTSSSTTKKITTASSSAIASATPNTKATSSSTTKKITTASSSATASATASVTASSATRIDERSSTTAYGTDSLTIKPNLSDFYNCNNNNLNKKEIKKVYDNIFNNYKEDVININTSELYNSTNSDINYKLYDFIRNLNSNHINTTINKIILNSKGSIRIIDCIVYIEEQIINDLNYNDCVYISYLFDILFYLNKYTSAIIRNPHILTIFNLSKEYHTYLSCNILKSDLFNDDRYLLLFYFYHFFINCKFYNKEYFKIDKQLFIQIILFKIINCIVQRCISAFGVYNPSMSSSSYIVTDEDKSHQNIIKNLIYIYYLILEEFYDDTNALKCTKNIIRLIETIISDQQLKSLIILKTFFSIYMTGSARNITMVQLKKSLNISIGRVNDIDLTLFKSNYPNYITSLLNEIKILLINDKYFEKICIYIDNKYIPYINIIEDKSTSIISNDMLSHDIRFINIYKLLDCIKIRDSIMEIKNAKFESEKHFFRQSKKQTTKPKNPFSVLPVDDDDDDD
jgi:hypothetical protein